MKHSRFAAGGTDGGALGVGDVAGEGDVAATDGSEFVVPGVVADGGGIVGPGEHAVSVASMPTTAIDLHPEPAVRLIPIAVPSVR